jgi:carbamate kinase
MGLAAARGRMKIVIALGGNALLRRGQPLEADIQARNIAVAAESVARVARDHAVALTHGNGPQVGLLALQAEAYHDVRPYPLDVLGAETEGMIGYLLEQELRQRMPGKQIATLLTQVEVDADDPAFASPSKPIGPVYTREQAERLRAERGYAIAPDGDAFRRVVPSPEPRRILELDTIRLLVDVGALVICGGGGGIPVATKAGVVRGVEAVIDKDLAASMLARDLGADALLMLTDVDGVYDGYGTTEARRIARATPAELRACPFARGSMGPKVEAACRFVEQAGGFAGIGRLEDAVSLLEGTAGTVVLPD